jgi:hypothetical protein
MSTTSTVVSVFPVRQRNSDAPAALVVSLPVNNHPDRPLRIHLWILHLILGHLPLLHDHLLSLLAIDTLASKVFNLLLAVELLPLSFPLRNDTILVKPSSSFRPPSFR